MWKWIQERNNWMISIFAGVLCYKKIILELTQNPPKFVIVNHISILMISWQFVCYVEWDFTPVAQEEMISASVAILDSSLLYHNKWNKPRRFVSLEVQMLITSFMSRTFQLEEKLSRQNVTWQQMEAKELIKQLQ